MIARYKPFEGFLRTFFGPGNRLRWENLEAHPESDAFQRLRPFLEELRSGWNCLILPRVWSDNRVSWYAMAPTPRQARALREELVAFAGPSFTCFFGQMARLGSDDTVEAAVQKLAANNVFRLDVVDSKLQVQCRDSLSRLLRVRSTRPSGRALSLRPPGRVLRDFELALPSADQEAARGYLDELQKLGRLSAENLRFISIRYHEAFGEWRLIEAMLEDGAILAVRRPARVTQALIRTIYRKELARFEVTGEAEPALARFRENVWPRFAGLYRSRSGMDAPEVLKSFMLAAAAADPPATHRRDALLDSCSPMNPDRPYLEALARLIPDAAVAPPPDPLDEAQRAFAEGDVDWTLALLRDVPPSLGSLALVLRAASEAASFEATGQALSALDAAPVEMRETLLSVARWRSLRETLTSRVGGSDQVGPADAAPAVQGNGGWHEWLARLRAEPGWTQAIEVAAQGADEWSFEEEERRPDRASAIAEAILGYPETAVEVLYQVLPHLLRFYIHRAGPRRVFKPVYGALLDRCLYDPQPNIETVRAAGVLLEALVEVGVTQPECFAHVKDLVELWSSLPSPRLIDWSLDLLDTLVVSQVPPHVALVHIADEVRRQFLRWTDRRQPAQLALFEQLCRELLIDSALPTTQDEDGVAVVGEDPLVRMVATRSIALYSLREETLARVCSVLEVLSQAADIRVFSDQVGSEPLRHAARHADVFLIVTGAAKHAATEFIEANRPRGATTLRCHQTGSATVLRLLSREANRG